MKAPVSRLLHLFFLSLLVWPCSAGPVLAQELERPNILWITTEDMSANLGSYGDPQAHTPHLDRLAREGIRYTNAYATAPVCAPARSTIITGLYQTSIGTHHMRSAGRLPEHVRPFTMYLREAGYYTTNNAKEDYNFPKPPGTWDESSSAAHWRGRPDPGQPFFAVFNLLTTHESRIASDARYAEAVADLPPEERHDPDALTLPPYYPDTPVVRRDWARYYDLIATMDQQVGEILRQLEEDGLTDNTIVFFYSDHGVGLPRGKRWLNGSGLHVPLLVRLPPRWRRNDQGTPGTVADELVSFVDLAPTALHLAGVDVPGYMQGRAFLGDSLTPPRDYAFGARDRMDERYDIVRAVMDGQYTYIRYYEPFKPYFQYMNTPEKGAIMQELRRVHAEGGLPPTARRLMADEKPSEELFDTARDPHEVRNLAGDTAYAEVLRRMREAHVDWVERTLDIGFVPEPVLRRLEDRHDASIYTLARSEEGLPIPRAREVAALWTEESEAVPELAEALGHEDESVRYWAATSLGNLGPDAEGAAEALRQALNDASPVVRVAAARALARMGQPGEALPVLAEALRGDRQWVRLHAAIVLDEMNEQARPALEVMQDQMAYRDDMVQRGKYTVRVLNRALNELLGTENVVD